MAYKTQPTASYVKFVRGTKEIYSQLAKNNDTLYFVYDNENSTTGDLYLGTKKIGSGGISSLTELINETVNDGDLLIYDQNSNSWIPLSVDDAIRTMTGATAAADGQSGLVPVPHVGDQDKFLRGDGTWASIAAGDLAAVDNITIEVNSQNKLSLKGFSTASVGTLLQKTENGLEWVSTTNLKPTYKKITNISDVNEEGTIYFISNNSGTDNSYDEYMYIDGKAELIGNTATVNLDNYVTKTSFNNLTSVVNNKVDIVTFNSAVNEINERLSWQEMVEES